MRAVIYTRQSVDRAGDGLAVARQQKDCVKLCGDRGWTVTRVVTDNDVSASNRKPRPGFIEVMRMVDTRECDVVVVWHVDRLVRKLVDLEDVIERCERAGVRLATVSGDIDLSTDAGRLVGRILASVARGEVERKSARQRRARQQAADAGRPIQFSHRPFGYREDKVTPEPVEVDAVVQGCRLLLSGGSLRAVTRLWNDAGLLTPQRSRGFTTQTVRAILRNPRIAGLATYHGEVVATGDWTPLVGEETWRAVRALLDDPARQASTRGVRSLLGGLATCPSGDRVFSSRNTRGAPAYRCRERVLSSRPTTGVHVCRQAAPVDEYVTALVIERMSRPDAVDLLVDHDRPDVEALRSEARALRARLEEIAYEFADDPTMPAAMVRTMTERVRTKLVAVEAEIADAGRVSVLGSLIGVEDVRDRWEGLDLDQRRGVIDTLMTVTLFSPGRGSRSFDPATVKVEPKE